MGSNGKRRPPRPQIEMISPAPPPEEAAAVAAAIEQFLVETAPAPSTARPRMNPWLWAGLQEGVNRADLVAPPPPSG